ncbi:restriction endonuclease subunit S [Pseudoalteromonas sp. SCSIO 43095]|uniref:restriction endonuclease subunit S n=1 Tax=unclassified Pseudoalteromonas TaxID=194690 RepID=UPI0004466818|nr:MULTISPECIES: restriction endonuclease subunit S [unclassified Pseudoalteromonas]EWS96494.1 type I restriction modification protein subunit S [Pseudoalteromonas sp. SCSIO_11900]URR00154.1 restriction endonuclease subunit S [Pseudoalteromonas sp. SCSIO 43095]
MGSDWPLVSLGDYCVKIGSGATPRGGSSVYKEYGEICLIRSQNIYNDGFKPQGLVYIDEDAAKKLKNVVIEKNDILLNITGDSVARVCLAVESYLPARVNQHVAIIRPNPKEFDARYLRYVISSSFMQKVLLNLASAGATRNALTKTMIETLEVSKPPLIIQKNIADCLESLDDKIFLNNQTNQTLEQMAQALFKSWFVDFDPVFDNLLASVNFKLENLETSLPDELKQKAQRRLAALNSLHNAAEIKTSLSALAHELQAQLPTKEATKDATQSAVQVSEKAAETPVKANFNANPTILAQHANTHAHFPNEFEHNEQLGWIPKGWEVESIYESIDIVYGAPFKSKQFNNDAIGYPIIRIRDLKTGSPQNWSDELHPKRTLIKAGDIVVGMDAEFRATVWSGEDGFLNQRLFLAKGRKKYISNLFIKYSLAPLLAFQEHTQVGTTVAHLGKKEIDRFEILMPSNSILKQSSDFFEDIKDKIVQNYKSTTQLTKLRDTLLPKLISGELQIPDVITDEEVVD